MGTGWAVGSATMLALAAAGYVVGLGVMASASAFIFVALIPLTAVWAYTIAMGAHGSRTALVALIVDVVVVSVSAPFLLWEARSWSGDRLGAALAILTPLIGALTLYALGHEVRRRSGPIRVGTIIVLALPLIGVALIFYAARILASG